MIRAFSQLKKPFVSFYLTRTDSFVSDIMFPNLSSPQKLYFNLSAEIPADFNGYLLPGANILTATGNRGTIVLQEFKEGDFHIQLSSFYFLEKIKLVFRPNKMLLNTPVSLQNNFTFRSKEIKNIEIKQDQFAILHLAGQPYEALFEKEKNYQLFNINYTKEMVSEFSLAFPSLMENLFNWAKQGKAFAFTKPTWISGDLKDVAQKVIHCPYEGDLRKYFFDIKVREYLFLLFFQHYSGEKDSDNISVEERGKIVDIAALLGTKLKENFPVPDLARKAQMNENKLQSMFRQLYGKGVFEYRRDIRLEEARRLILEERLQIKEVYSMAGYKSITAFITEFKKYFGYSPGSLKKKS